MASLDCATPHQIRGLQSISAGELAQVPGYEHLSEESQEQLKLALRDGKISDKGFKDIRPDLVKSGRFMCEFRDAVGYKVEVTPSARAGCRAAACKEQEIKIAKGELRLGIARMFDSDHVTFVYKHWKCASAYDLNTIKEYAEQDLLDGLGNLPEEYKTAVLESLEKEEVVEPPKLNFPAPVKTRGANKKKVEVEEDDETSGKEPAPTRSSRKEQKEASEKRESDPDQVVEEAPAKKPARKKHTLAKMNSENETDETLSNKRRGRNANLAHDDALDGTATHLPTRRNSRGDTAPADNKLKHGEETKVISTNGDATNEVVEAIAMKKRGRKVVSVAEDEAAGGVEVPTLKRKRGRKAVAITDDDPVDEATETTPKKKKAIRKAANTATSSAKKPDAPSADVAFRASQRQSGEDADPAIANIVQPTKFMEDTAAAMRPRRY